MRIPIILFAAALAAAPAVAFGQAGSEFTTNRVTVRLSDLDLGTSAGARIAVRRLSQAASRACGADPTVAPDLITQSGAFHRCRGAALADAVAQAGAPALAQALDEAGPDQGWR